MPTERRNTVKILWFTPWQWAVISCLVGLVAISAVGYLLLDKVDNAATQADANASRASAISNRANIAAATTVRLSDRTSRLSTRTNKLARQVRTAVCTEILFLENSARVTRQFIEENPNDPEVERRRESYQRLLTLIVELRESLPGCPRLSEVD